jgi:hypothetical protein
MNGKKTDGSRLTSDSSEKLHTGGIRGTYYHLSGFRKIGTATDY